MDPLVAFVGDGYVLSACDEATYGMGGIMMKDNQDKIMELDSNKLLSAVGQDGDVVQFTEYIQKNIHLNKYRTGLEMSVAGTANYIRGEIAKMLRQAPCMVNMILAGFEKNGSGPSVYSIDYLGTMHGGKYVAAGYAQYFILSAMDRKWRKDLSLEEGLELLRQCIDTLYERAPGARPNYVVKIADKDGCRKVSEEELAKAGISFKKTVGEMLAAKSATGEVQVQ